MSELREALLSGAADPILDFEYIKADLGISHATFHRGPRQELPIVRISARRLGVRRPEFQPDRADRGRGERGGGAKNDSAPGGIRGEAANNNGGFALRDAPGFGVGPARVPIGQGRASRTLAACLRGLVPRTTTL